MPSRVVTYNISAHVCCVYKHGHNYAICPYSSQGASDSGTDPYFEWHAVHQTV